jgi:hypothetical protein
MVGNVFFATEKLWRCIAACRPFIIVGSQYYLKNLRRLGFRTFSDFWDEGYDDYGPTQRIKEVEKLIQQLAKKSLKEMQMLLVKIQPVLDHNLETFKTLTYQQIKETFDE